MKKRQKLLLVIVAITLGCSLWGCKQSDPKEMQDKFKQFMKDEIKAGIQNDYLSLHTLVGNPERYGVKQEAVEVQIMAPYQSGEEAKYRKELAKKIDTLAAIDQDVLTKKQQTQYTIAQDQLDVQMQLADEKFDYMDNKFEALNGLHNNVPIMLSDFIFYDEQDMQDMVTLLKSVKPVFESYMEYAKKQKEAGYFMSNYGVDKVVKYCDRIINGGLGETMLTTIKQNLDQVTSVEEQKRTNYKTAIEEAYQQAFVPAYQLLIDTFNTLKDTRNHDEGLVKVANGKAFYEALYRYYTGSTLSIKEAIKMLDGKLIDCLAQSQSLLTQDEEVLELVMADDLQSGFNDYDSMLEALDAWYPQHFPKINMPAFDCVNSNLLDVNMGAYYMQPRLDEEQVNLIRVNPSAAKEIHSFTTLYYIAHEGIPGHMYYYNYLNQKHKDDFNFFCANYLGFSEGFANYAARYALSVSKANPLIIELSALNMDLNWAITSRLDIGVHYEGWDFTAFKKYLSKYFLGELATQEMYDDIQSSPASGLSYGIGYFEILDLRDKAETELGDNFNDKQFNKALLKAGSAPFSVIEENIEDYIDQQK